jgi:hypothetical protein
MAEVLARVQLSPIFRNFKSRIENLRDSITVEGGKILRRETESSIRLRWYDSGKTLNSLEEEVITSGESQRYILTPTATSAKGAPYPLFGEYGTGRRGAATGRPAPRGYRYGDSKGMKARRYSRIAVGIAKPQVIASAKGLIANFTVN